MSYGFRNTIILLVVLLVMAGGGWGYIYFYQSPKLDKLRNEVDKKHRTLGRNREIADQYSQLKKQYKASLTFYENYDKALYQSSNEDDVFEFLNNHNQGISYADFTFSFNDSTNNNKFGYLSMQITGVSYYRNFINFVRKIELSKPLNKISDISISPVDKVEDYGKINFNFNLKSYYDRAKLLGKPNLKLVNNDLGSTYNPFFPIIRKPKANKDNLVNVAKSKLLALSGNRVFLTDQDDVMHNLKVGDRVYLGRLSSVNIHRGSAIFTLNNGGIIKRDTLSVNNVKKNE